MGDSQRLDREWARVIFPRELLGGPLVRDLIQYKKRCQGNAGRFGVATPTLKSIYRVNNIERYFNMCMIVRFFHLLAPKVERGFYSIGGNYYH